MKTVHCTNKSKQYIHKKYDQYSTCKLFTTEKNDLFVYFIETCKDYFMKNQVNFQSSTKC